MYNEDYRMTHLVACYGDVFDLYNGWNRRNMLYNSLLYKSIIRRDIEQTKDVLKILEKTETTLDKRFAHKDIMFGWWTPAKYYLFRKRQGNGVLSIKELLLQVPKGKNISVLVNWYNTSAAPVSGCQTCEKTMKNFMNFLSSVYLIGNMTTKAYKVSGGVLDGWDSKLKSIHEEAGLSEKEWNKYISDNCFDDFVEGENVVSFISENTVCSKTDDEFWNGYFTKVTNVILSRTQKILEKYDS